MMGDSGHSLLSVMPIIAQTATDEVSDTLSRNGLVECKTIEL